MRSVSSSRGKNVTKLGDRFVAYKLIMMQIWDAGSKLISSQINSLCDGVVPGRVTFKQLFYIKN